MKKRTKILLCLLVVIILVSASVFGVITYQNWKTEMTITEYQTKIENVVKTFSDSEERAEKLEILRNLLNEASRYNDSENPITEIKQKYKQEIQSMKLCFVEMYDTEIAQNTLSDVETITDKKALNNATMNLSALLEIIENEHELTLTGAEHTEYVNNINLLIEVYNNQVADIEKAEEEERLKAEAEAEAKAEQEAKAKEQARKSNSTASSNGNKTNNSSSNSTDSNGAGLKFNPNDDSNLPSGWYHSWDTDENGNKIEGTDTWHNENGDIYDKDGNYLGNIWDL